LVNLVQKQLEDYSDWLSNGVKSLTEEVRRIQSVYISPSPLFADKFGPEHLSSAQMSVVKQMKDTVQKGITDTQDMQTAVSDLLAVVRRMKLCDMDSQLISDISGLVAKKNQVTGAVNAAAAASK
jgi:hypothetical protein